MSLWTVVPKVHDVIIAEDRGLMAKQVQTERNTDVNREVFSNADTGVGTK
jgi:hypothetical protein